ncbi:MULTISPECIES: hypothetical protein [unclassified Streptomyces]|uniref:hypothetical protein n=1 Tax=unclassified Streptomyces TaxID=2593676 RepID=UPI002E2C8D97|nr:hypothetical protein [Streptomyces sp. NBC_00228]
MALSIEDLKNLATTVIENADGPTHVGTGAQVNTTAEPQNTNGGTVVTGDNHGGIRQTFRR